MSAAGRALLAERLAAVPGLLRARPRRRLLPPFDVGALHRIRVTGAGASGGHARLLAARLAEAGLPARVAPPARFAGGPGPGTADEGLVVFSQGLSPNARAALARPEAWGAVVLVTSAHEEEPAPDTRGEDAEGKRAFLAELGRAGVWIVDLGAPPEYGTLVRLQGPALGLLATLELAHAFGAAEAVDPEAAADAFAAAAARAEEAAHALPAPVLATAETPWLCLAGAGDPEWTDAQRLKLAEGLRRPLPPACDLLDFAHGPFQQLFGDAALLVAFAGGEGRDAAAEEALLARLARMLEPRHTLVRFPARHEGSLALFEREAAADALLLRALELRRLDPADWPGRDRDGPLYGMNAPLAAPAATEQEAPPTGAPPLAALTWTELEGRLAAGARTAVVPLGSTEQHGPHLPFATDTWIADALAARFCARVPEALRLPALPVGCASEHLAFPGTLHLDEATLAAVLRDLARSLGRHGFARLFLFSGHGGNVAPLRRAAPALADAAGGARVTVFTDHRTLTARLHAEAARAGVSQEAAGHHAGEIEASIVAALRPGALRPGALAAGLAWAAADTRALFYPDLRVRAPDGTVGDPRAADPARAERYLATWTELLVEAYRADDPDESDGAGDAEAGARKKRHAT